MERSLFVSLEIGGRVYSFGLGMGIIGKLGVGFWVLMERVGDGRGGSAGLELVAVTL